LKINLTKLLLNQGGLESEAFPFASSIDIQMNDRLKRSEESNNLFESNSATSTEIQISQVVVLSVITQQLINRITKTISTQQSAFFLISQIQEIQNRCFIQELWLSDMIVESLAEKNPNYPLELGNFPENFCLAFVSDNKGRMGQKILIKANLHKEVDADRSEFFKSISANIKVKSARQFEEVVYIGKEHVARIIGSKGSVIKAMQAATKTRIRVEQNNIKSDEALRSLHLAGEKSRVLYAKRLVQTFMQIEAQHYKDQISTLFDHVNITNKIVFTIPIIVMERLKSDRILIMDTIRQFAYSTRTQIAIDPSFGADLLQITIKGINVMDVQKCHDTFKVLCMGSERIC